jgi:hypothetical protein
MGINSSLVRISWVFDEFTSSVASVMSLSCMQTRDFKVISNQAKPPFYCQYLN